MPIYAHITHFAGYPVIDWPPESTPPDPERVIYRLSLSWEDQERGRRWEDKLAKFLKDPASVQICGLVVGPWGYEGGSANEVIEALVKARDRLSKLRAIFLGDIVMEEYEISWIEQGDVAPLFQVFSELEHFCARGGSGLSLGTLRHNHLKTLILQSGGLPAGVVRQVAQAELPALEHLELWLGSSNYGGNAEVADLAPILDGSRFPRLRYLGLRDSEITDKIAAALSQAPILERIEVLDLSLGTLGNTGAAALLKSPAIGNLVLLDLHHNFLSDEMVEQLYALEIEVDAGDRQTAEEYGGQEWRYVAVSE